MTTRAMRALMIAVVSAFGLSTAAAQTTDRDDETAVERGDRDARTRSRSKRDDPDLVERRAELIDMADDALRRLRRDSANAAELMEQAYGHAVFATTKGGLLLTGAGGTGVARSHDGSDVTFMRLGSAGIGLGAGFESYRLVLLFRDRDTYESFVSGEWDGLLAAQAAAGTGGVAAEEPFLGGIRAFRVAGGGLMAQVDVTGARFWPAKNLNRAAEVEARVAEAARTGVPAGPEAGEEARVAEAGEPAPADETLDEPTEPEARAAATFDDEPPAPGRPERLDEIAAERDDLSIFVDALKAVGLDDALTGETPYTVFAPTDEAFDATGVSRDELLAPENREALIRMLRAHIVADDLDRTMAGNIGEALTVDGDTVSVDVEGDRFTVGDASVVEPDLVAGNLRVHVIDALLARPQETAVAEAEEVEAEEESQEPRAQDRPARQEQSAEPSRQAPTQDTGDTE